MDDSKESASSKPEGTPTGRIKSDSLIDFMDRWMGPTPTYLRDSMAALENSPEIPILTGIDYSHLEARTVAILVGHRGGKLWMKEILEGDFFQGLKADLMVIDEISLIDEKTFGRDLSEVHGIQERVYRFLDEPPVPEPRMIEKPVKQNGRDASYLDLDPTKKHRRRRR